MKWQLSFIETKLIKVSAYHKDTSCHVIIIKAMVS